MNGMAEVIAETLSKHSEYVRDEDVGGAICNGCGWEVASKWPEANVGKSTKDRMNEHEAYAVTVALTKAGYGKLEVPCECGAMQAGKVESCKLHPDVRLRTREEMSGFAKTFDAMIEEYRSKS